MTQDVASPRPSEHWGLCAVARSKLGAACQWQNEEVEVRLLSHLQKNHLLSANLQFSSTSWRGRVSCSLRLLTLILPKSESKWALLCVPGGEWWHQWYGRDPPFSVMRSECQKVLLTQGSQDLCFTTWGWPYAVTAKAREACSEKPELRQARLIG